MIDSTLTQDFKNTDCEKNWVYLDFNNQTSIVYQWNPLQICIIDDENNKISIIETKILPKIFDFARGSSSGFNYVNSSNQNEIWFVVHIVSYEKPRHYYHMISVFDEKMNILRYSAPFKFEGDNIEYCLSIVVENDRVLINYSTMDRSTKIGVYDKKYIDSLLIYL